MAKYASIKVRPKTEAKPSPRTMAHNQRLAKNIDLLPEEHRLPNYHLNRLSNLTKTFKVWEQENEERYQKINGRKLRSDASRLESLAIILSGEQVAKCSPDEIWQRALEFKEWFERKYKTKVRTMDWHRDEGHINDDGEVERNDHIHIEYDNVNEDGKVVRRLFSKGDLIKFQDQIAEIYKPLGFVRGEDTAKRSPTHPPKRGKTQKEWKRQKKNEALAKIKDINAVNKRLRAKLQEMGAEREHYAKLEQTIKELKAQAKAKDLTIDDLKNRINWLENDFYGAEVEIEKKDAQIANLEAENRELRAENSEMSERAWELEDLAYDVDYRALDEYDMIYTRITPYKVIAENQEKEIEELRHTIAELRSKLRELREMLGLGQTQTSDLTEEEDTQPDLTPTAPTAPTPW